MCLENIHVIYIVVGMIKTGNIDLRAGIQHTSLVFPVSLLSITPSKLWNGTTLATYMWFLALEASACLS